MATEGNKGRDEKAPYKGEEGPCSVLQCGISDLLVGFNLAGFKIKLFLNLSSSYWATGCSGLPGAISTGIISDHRCYC